MSDTAQDTVPVSLPVLPTKSRPLKRSRASRWRFGVLIAIQIAIVVHVVHWVFSGRTVSPVEPSESMEFVKRGVVNAGAIFFGVAMLATLVFGRWFCGWACHLVLLQDGCAWIMRRLGIRPKPFRSRLLVYVPFVLALYMFVWPAVFRWGVVPLSRSLHARLDWIPALGELAPWRLQLEATTPDFWQTFPTWAVAVPFLLICGFATVYFLGAKGFCTYGCPYGGFFAPLDQYAPARIRVTDACEHCGHCTAACSSNVRVHEEVAAYGMVVDPGCMKCLDCVSTCPNDALYWGFGRPAVGKEKPRGAEPKRVFDLSLGEEIALAIVFLGSFLAWRGVYAIVPMLMAVGMAGCITFIVWKAWRVLRDASVSLHKHRLKFKGALTRRGAIYLGLAGVVVLLTIHSGAVNLLEHLAGRADGRVTIPRSAVFTTSPMALPDEMADAAARAQRLYTWAGPIRDGGIGLLGGPGLLIRRAWLAACEHDFAEAERLMRLAVDRHGATDPLCRDITYLMLVQVRDREAIAFGEAMLEAHPGFSQTLDVVALWHQSEGDLDTAIALCRRAAGRTDPDDPAHLHALRRLSLLLSERGDLEESVEVFHRTIEIDDGNPASYRLLAEVEARLGRTEDALATIERAIALAPDDPDQYDLAAGLLETLGRFPEAGAYRDEAARRRAAGGP